MTNIESNNPTDKTTETWFGPHKVKIYNYCPCCRGELASCRLDTEVLFYDNEGKTWHWQFEEVQKFFWGIYETFNNTAKDRRHSVPISIILWKQRGNYGEKFSYEFKGTLEQFVNIYNIATNKHLDTI